MLRKIIQRVVFGFVFLAMGMPATSWCSETDPQQILSEIRDAWASHLKNRERIEYRFTAEYTLPPGQTVREGGPQLLEKHNNVQMGTYTAVPGRSLLEWEAFLQSDGKKLESSTEYTHDSEIVRHFKLANRATRSDRKDRSPGSFRHDEERIINLCDSSPLWSWLEDRNMGEACEYDMTVSEADDDEGGSYYRITHSWSMPDPTSGTLRWDFRNSFFFDRKKGNLPVRIETFRHDRQGMYPDRLRTTTFTVSEVLPGVHLITGYELEHGGWVGDVQEWLRSDGMKKLEPGAEPGKFKVTLYEIHLGDAITTPTFSLPEGVKVHEARRPNR